MVFMARTAIEKTSGTRRGAFARAVPPSVAMFRNGLRKLFVAPPHGKITLRKFVPKIPLVLR
jgi:hypothetical protein